MSTGYQKSLPQLPEGYEYVRELSSGNYGIVWLVHNKNIKRDEAIKILFRKGETEYHRFRREIETIATLKHPNIVTVYYAKPEELYFIMEYLPFSFSMWLKQKDFSSFEGIKFLYHVARGLYFAHEKGLIHRDLKPGNVLFSDEKIPKITDFGLVKDTNLAKAGKDDLTGSVSLGTPRYMSPEQWEDSKIIDHRTDIWSLGVMLYEVIAKENPFANLSGFQLASAVISKPIEAPSKICSSMNIWEKMAEPICMRALTRDPEKRYQTALEMAKDLEKIFDIEDETFDLATAERLRPSSLDGADARFQHRKIIKTLLFVFGFLFIATLAVTVILFQKWEKEQQEHSTFEMKVSTLQNELIVSNEEKEKLKLEIIAIKQEKEQLIRSHQEEIRKKQQYWESSSKTSKEDRLEISELKQKITILEHQLKTEKEKYQVMETAFAKVEKSVEKAQQQSDSLREELEKSKKQLYEYIAQNQILQKNPSEADVMKLKMQVANLEEEISRLIFFENALYKINLVGKGIQVGNVYNSLESKGFFMRTPIKVSKNENVCIYFSQKNPPEKNLENKINYIVGLLKKELGIDLEVRMLRSNDKNDEIKIELRD